MSLTHPGKIRPIPPKPLIQLWEPQAIAKLQRGHRTHFPFPTGSAEATVSSSGQGSDEPDSAPQAVSRFQWELQAANYLVRETERAWSNFHQAEGGKNSGEGYAKFMLAVDITNRLDAAYNSFSPTVRGIIELQLERSTSLRAPRVQSN
ncbi:hypothetical protein H1R20_g9377, partial [Candolleomyces eurysporus]